MASILLANEFGTGLGHINHLAMLARRLDARHRLVFAVENTAFASPVLQRHFGESVAVIQGSTWAAIPERAASRGPTRTLADPFNLFGLGDADVLGAVAAHWDGIIARHRPNLIIADAAPALRVAAAGRVPMVVIGSGYTVPPPGQPLPLIRPEESEKPEAARVLEARMLGGLNAVRIARGDIPFAHFADAFAGDDTFVCTLPDFDPYAAHRTAPQIWPYVQPLLAPGPPVAERDSAALFAYLPAEHAMLKPVLEALGATSGHPQVFVSGADPLWVAARCRPNVVIHRRPADFAAVLPRCRVLIHHGGLATASAGLMAGTPQLALPLQLEHIITATAVCRAGAGIAIGGASRPDAAQLGAAIEAIRREPAYADAAAAAATRLALEARPEAVLDIVAACERHIAGA